MQNFKKHSEEYLIALVMMIGVFAIVYLAQSGWVEAKKGEGIVYEPYSGVTDHCVTDASGVTNRSLYDILQTIGTSRKATVKFKNDNESGSTTAYKVVSASGGNFASYSNVYFEFEPGAMLESGVTLSGVTLPSPANVIAQPNQQIMSGTSLYFATPGTIYHDWFETNATQGTTDMTSAVQASFSSAAAGSTIKGVPGSSYLIGGTGNEVISVVKNINFVSDATYKVTAATGAATDIFHINIPGETIKMLWADFRIDPVSGTPGRYGIHIENDDVGQQMAYCEFNYITIDQLGSYAFYVNNTQADGWFDNKIHPRIMFGGIRLIGAGDSVEIYGGLIGGTGYSIYSDNISGAGSLWVHHMTLISISGGLYVEDCTNLIVTENYFEQPSTLNNGTHSALLTVKGGAAAVSAAMVTGNRMTATPTKVDNILYIDDCDFTLINRNTLALGTSSQKIAYITAKADRTKMMDNYYPGVGTNDPTNYVTNLGSNTTIQEGTGDTTAYGNVFNDQDIKIEGKRSNIMGNWEFRGGTIATAVGSGATITDEAYLVTTNPGLGYAASAFATIGTTSGGTVEVTFSGVTLPTYNYAYYMPYVIMNSALYWPYVSNLKVEYLNTDGVTWDEIFNAAPTLLTATTWAGSHSLYVGYPIKGTRWTFTFNAVQTIYISEVGLYNKAHIQGSSFYYATYGLTAISTGAGTVKMGSANPGTNIGWLEIQPGKFIPYWTDATP